MHSRTVSDQVTALLIGSLLYLACTSFGAPLPIAIGAAVPLYAPMILAFLAYRRSQRALQPARPVVRVVVEDDPKTTRRRRHLHAA